MPREKKGQIRQLTTDRRKIVEQRAQSPVSLLPVDEGTTDASQPTKAQLIAAILDQPDMEFVDWKKLMGEGVVVKVHIRRVRFRKRLQFSDLGIHFGDAETAKAMQEVFRLGMKNLLTKEYLDRIEQIEYRARKLLIMYSYETIWGAFIPVTAYGEFRERLQNEELAYYAVRDEILSKYPDIKKQVLADYVQAAKSAYRILNNVNPEVLSERELKTEAYYLAGVRHAIRKILPTPEDIRQSFGFEISQTYIDLPVLAGEDADLSDVEAGKSTIEGVTGEEQRELRWRQWSTKDRQTMMRMMNEEVVRDARLQKQERIDAFFTKVVSQLRGLLYEATSNVLASLKKHEKLQPRSVVQLRNLVENLEMLNFYGDRDVERAMKLIENLIDRPHEDRNIELIEQRLGEIALVMRSTLLPLEYEFREEREEAEEATEWIEKLGIPSRPTRREVREARMSLGFTIPAWDDVREEREDEEGVGSPLLVGEAREERSW
ncbi:hypothetical protein C5B42_01365 [Candidatus Cerribacteria bacterium 'Amazon FNV 2010 28 9']|uniref:Uncharacterized protein n=1 Tax=Candidatus Cerribacteria bacterium 'Amazon FNV 2010 28 9' TaxID=2081795 RepID=A0A317JQK9_9BACT|nr:MAG: hypothetical protein C5B42_01365 [Candidatus Cerribacteria bacterium 'Amazon FNV 2010 28 9']